MFELRDAGGTRGRRGDARTNAATVATTHPAIVHTHDDDDDNNINDNDNDRQRAVRPVTHMNVL
jgi:hypothetical protein